MRTSIAILLFIVCCYSSPLQEEDYQSLFTKWAVTHGKNYELDTFFKRYSIFKQNLDYINDHNAQNSSFEMAMNNFGDLTFEEFSAAYTGLLPGLLSPSENTSEIFDENPSSQEDVTAGSIDWRNKGAVNGIQDQLGCGSCYAFSAVASIEAAWAIKKGKLLKVSEQQVVDCSRTLGNKGCSGGNMEIVYNYVIKNGIAARSSYPYNGKENTCQASKYSPVIRLSSSKKVAAKNEGAMLSAVNSQPISVAIAADKPFQFYSSGVLDNSSCGTGLNHAVNIVGYGNASGKDYWIVRNSWGSGFGEKGYIRMVRNKNMCGIALYPTFPIV